jgi:hypothetical protein
VRHPVFQTFGADTGLLGSARFSQFAALDWPGAAVVARFSNGAPALVELPSAPGRVLVFASDVANAWNDFALHPAFVPFVHGLVRYLAGAAPAAQAIRVGEWPDREAAAPGVIAIRAGQPAGERRVAVNVDPAEADTARLAPAAFLAALPRSALPPGEADRAEARARERDQSLWRYGLMAMLAALAIESAIGRRV